MPNVDQLTLANDVFHRLERHGSQHRPASQLVASAAIQVGFVRLAMGIARWSQESNGHNEIQQRLSNEQFDVIMLAPIDFSSRAAMTSMDLCAAAAYRLSGVQPLPNDRESDVNHLQFEVQRGRVTLRPSIRSWMNQLVASSQWQLLSLVRTVVTHRAVEGHSYLGSGPPSTELVLDGIEYDNVTLTSKQAKFVELQFAGYVKAVLSDFP